MIVRLVQSPIRPGRRLGDGLGAVKAPRQRRPEGRAEEQREKDQHRKEAAPEKHSEHAPGVVEPEAVDGRPVDAEPPQLEDGGDDDGRGKIIAHLERKTKAVTSPTRKPKPIDARPCPT